MVLIIFLTFVCYSNLDQVHNTPHCRSLMRLIIKVIDNGIFERSLVFPPSNMFYNRPTCLLLFVDVLDGNIWGNPFQQVLHGRSDRGAWLNCWCRWTGTSSNKPWSTSAWKWDWKWLQGSCGGHPVVNFDQCFWTKEMRKIKYQIKWTKTFSVWKYELLSQRGLNKTDKILIPSTQSTHPSMNL